MKSRRLFTVLLMVWAIAGTMAIATVDAFELGYEGVGSETNQGESMVGTYFDLVVPDGYLATFTEIHVYMMNDSTVASTLQVQVGIYDGDTNLLVDESDVFYVTAEGWYNLTVDATVQSGTYVLAVACGGNGVWRYYDIEAGYNSDWATGGPPIPSSVTWNDWDAYRVSIYADYEFTALVADPMLVGVYTFGYVAIIVILLVVFFKGTPLLMMVFGGLGITISAGLWSSEYVIFTPFLQIASVIVSFLLLVYSFVIWKGN